MLKSTQRYLDESISYSSRIPALWHQPQEQVCSSPRESITGLSQLEKDKCWIRSHTQLSQRLAAFIYSMLYCTPRLNLLSWLLNVPCSVWGLGGFEMHEKGLWQDQVHCHWWPLGSSMLATGWHNQHAAMSYSHHGSVPQSLFSRTRDSEQQMGTPEGTKLKDIRA